MNSRSRPWLPFLLGTALMCWSARAHADGDTAERAASDAAERAAEPASEINPAAPHALGRVFTAGPAAKGLTLLASGGYAYTESVLGIGDAHHRVAGSLALDERPLAWLDVAFRLDGRYDAHVVPGQATDTGLVGDPRLFARADKAWAGGLALAARAGLWLPGRNAPSLELGAATPELVGAVSYLPRATAIALTANLGFRVDRSARSAPDAAQLSAGDRLALEVSAFDEILLGAAATFGRSRWQGFVEGSWDLLVGAGAPPPRSSPILVGAGGRLALGRSLRLEAEVEASPSSRPDVSATAPLVPIPPRVAFWLGLTYAFSGAPPPPAVAPPASEPAAAPPPPPPPPPVKEVEPAREPQTPKGQLRGLVRSLKGTAVAAEVTVEPETSPPGPAPAEATGDRIVTLRAEGGRFQLDVAPGRYRVTIAAPGFQSQKRTVDVEENGVTLLNVDLRSEH